MGLNSTLGQSGNNDVSLNYTEIRKRMDKIIDPIVIIAVTICLLTNVSGYSDIAGVQENDVIVMEYELRVDGELLDSISDFQVKVDRNNLIEGVYEGVLGMKVSQSKSLIVSPDKGYDSGALEGKTLHFVIYIRKILYNAHTSSYASSSGFSAIYDILLKVSYLVIGLGILLLLYMRLRSSVSVSLCIHCKRIRSVSVRSHGICKNCGGKFCRPSFSKGCPDCGANTLIPHIQKKKI